MRQRTKISAGIILFLLGVIYLGLWQYSANWFKCEIDNLYKHAEKSGVEFLGPKPVLTNFPFVPEIHYTVGIKAGNAAVMFPALRLRGYPIPFTTLQISFPQGVSLDGIADPAIWSLDALTAELAIPYRLPASFTQEDITKWQSTGGKIDVRDYLLQKQALESTGKGMFAFDENLQPIFLLESTVKNYESFIADQKDKGLIDGFPAAIGATLLNGLARTDEKTGEKIVHLDVSVKNRMLTVGPLQVLEFPLIVWDRRTPPAPRQ